jgi:hypothetical protein
MLRTLFAAAGFSTAALIGMTVSPSSAVAQAPLLSGCEDAAGRVNGAGLPRVGAPQWNDWVTLTGCGSRGATIIAGAIKADGVRGESELTRLDHLAGILDGWFQPQLVNAYEFILRAPDASNAMKLRAMWLLSGLYAPTVDVAGPLQGYMSARCETYERTTSLRDAPDRLPESAYDEARSAINFAADDRSSPEYVRATARCWEGVIREELSRSTIEEDDAPQVVHASNTVVVHRPVRVVYDCDNRFVFYNDAGYDLAVRYSGYGTGVLRVTRGGPFVWASARFGPVRFWMGDTEIYYETAVYRPCYSYGHRIIVGGPVYPWHGWHSGLGVYINVNVPIVRPRVRYVVRPVYTTRRTIFYPRTTRPIIVNQGRRDNDDWNRRRNDDRRDDNRGRGNDDRGRGRGNDDRGRTYGYYGTPPRNDTPEPRRGQRNDNGRTYGDTGRPQATPTPPAFRVPEMKPEAPRGRSGESRSAVPKGGGDKNDGRGRGGDDDGGRRAGPRGRG